MSSAFKRKISQSIGVAPTQVGGYTAPGATQVTAISLTVANTSAGTIKASVSLYNGVVDTYLVKNMDIIPGQSHSLIGGDQKVVMEPGDSIRVVSDTASSIDAILSVLEMA